MEDARVSKLRDALNKTLTGAIGGVKLEDFLNCFPELMHTHKAPLTELYQQLVDSVRPNVMQEFDKICEEFDLNGKLNQLDEAYNTGREISALEAQVANVSPEDRMREIRMRLKMQERDELRAMAQKADQECMAAKARLAAQQQRVLAMQQSINDASQQLTEAATIAHTWLEQSAH